MKKREKFNCTFVADISESRNLSLKRNKNADMIYLEAKIIFSQEKSYEIADNNLKGCTSDMISQSSFSCIEQLIVYEAMSEKKR